MRQAASYRYYEEGGIIPDGGRPHPGEPCVLGRGCGHEKSPGPRGRMLATRTGAAPSVC